MTFSTFPEATISLSLRKLSDLNNDSAYLSGFGT